MYTGREPRWLKNLSRRIPWLAIPNLALTIVSLQVLGFFMISARPDLYQALALVPARVAEGEIWRLVSFLALPWTMSPIGMLLIALFSYFILNMIESQWGSFRTTLYLLIGVVLTAVFAMIFGFPVANAYGLASTFFFAAATLFPQHQIHLFLVLPVKFKHLGFIALAFVLFRFLQETWMGRLYLLTVYANYLLFFGPALGENVRQWKRRRDFRAQFRDV
jgi:membrane associated rhomboid family serine protease